MKKRILIIGAGWEQYALIDTIKKNGCEIIATHPTLTAESFSLADHFFVKDSRDIQAHMNIAETHKIDGIISDNCDYSLYTAAVIASARQLPFVDLQSAIYSNDKSAQREKCADASIKQPEFCRVRTLDDLERMAQQISYPLILKPVDSRGTFGVTVVHDWSALCRAFYDALQHSPSRTLICEKFISGTLVTVDGFGFSNGHAALTVASRKFEQGAKPVTKEIIYPGLFSPELREKLLQNHNRVAAKLGYRFGHTHGEYIVTANEDIYLVECTNRGGGVYTSSVIVPLLTDLNLNQIYLDQVLARDTFTLEKASQGFMKRAVMLSFMDFEVGRVIKHINKDEVLRKDFVVRFRTIYSENDMVESVENCASRHSMLVLKGDNTKELGDNMEKFRNALQIQYYSKL